MIGAQDYALGDEMRGERATLGKSLLDVQRDLRIKAAYIAAIENCDPEVFPNPSFIPGYVRSYGRYLGLDAEAVYARFCAESGFSVHGATGRIESVRAKPGAGASGTFSPNFPMAEAARAGFTALPLSAIGSLMVLVALVAGLGYGGWTVLQNIQRVQFAPVEELPMALASVEALTAPDAPGLAEPAMQALASPVASAALADLYRRQEMVVPILAPRDGPIAAIDPERVGLLAARSLAAKVASPATDSVPLAAIAAGALDGAPVAAVPDLPGIPEGPALMADAGPVIPALTVIAERAAWIRVYLGDGTVVFERILETGESYVPPADLNGPMIWAGNSGSVYVRVGTTLHGPIGSGTRSVRDIALDPAAIAATFAPVAAIPESISRALTPSVEQAAAQIE